MRILPGKLANVFLIVCVCLVQFASNAQGNPKNLIQDPEFLLINKPDSPWNTRVASDGLARQEQPAGIECPVLRLRNSECSQTATLPAGLYELVATGWGSGELVIAVDGLGQRSLVLQESKAVYGYLFETSAAAYRASLSIHGDGFLASCELRPASPEQAAAWEQAKQSIQQFGYASRSPQRAAPGVPPPILDAMVAPLQGMTDRVVLEDPRMNIGNVHNRERLVPWLCANGFSRLDADEVGGWMERHTTRGTAYGSVAVIAQGIAPANLLAGEKQSPLWLNYLRAGGRIVNAGDLPFYQFEYADAGPLMRDAEERGLSLLGLDAGWHSPFWGKGDRPVTISPAGREWGFENVDSSITGFDVDSVSIAFGTFPVDANGRTGASSWFRNLRSDAPWSGLIKIRQHFDGNDDSALRDVWRAANYVGAPVAIPKLPAKQSSEEEESLTLNFKTSGVWGRLQWVQGEVVELAAEVPQRLRADAIGYEFRQGDKVLLSAVRAIDKSNQFLTIDTAQWALGEYSVVATAFSRRRKLASTTAEVGIRNVPPCHFPWMTWHQAGQNPHRTQIEFHDIKRGRMEALLSRATPTDFDAVVREGMGFAIRIDTKLTGNESPDFGKQPELFRMSASDEPIINAYSGGRPSLGISSPQVRRNAAESIQTPLKAIGTHPAFRPFVLCNDDYSVYYGWDYSPAVVRAFEAETGHAPPRIRPALPAPGKVDDDHPWLEWFRWTLRNVDGGFNRDLTAAATRIQPGVRIGPIPGAMQIPYVDLNQPAQYPPFHFGPEGFNLIASYYYNSFWQPVMTASFWMEVGRMENRTLPQWNMPDMLGTQAYTRNNLYHYLLGGANGLAYYRYAKRSAPAWRELQHLGEVVKRIGPIQATLAPVPRDIALVNSFTSGCFDPAHTLNQTYAYHNLMQGHFDVSIVSERELDAPFTKEHRAILLTQISWLSASAFETLLQLVNSGGLVMLDASIPFDIPGAVRIPLDIATGEEVATVPGRPPRLDDYGDPARIRRVARAIHTSLTPSVACDDIRLVSARFRASGLPCTWFVNAMDREEFLFCREHAGAGHPGAGTPEKVARLERWEEEQIKQGPFRVSLRVPKQAGTPYDVVTMKPVLHQNHHDEIELSLEMNRFGGALVVWLPRAVHDVQLRATPQAEPGGAFVLEANCRAEDGAASAKYPLIKEPVPYELVIVDAAGVRRSPSGVHMSTDGLLRLEAPIGRNELPSTWKVAVRELYSGKTATRELLVRHDQ